MRSMQTYAQRLKAALEHAGLSQAELARRIGISQQAVQFLCSGKAASSKWTAQIAQGCGVSAQWLASGSGRMAMTPLRGMVSEEELELIAKFRMLHPTTQAEIRERVEQEYLKAKEIAEQWKARER